MLSFDPETDLSCLRPALEAGASALDEPGGASRCRLPRQRPADDEAPIWTP